VSEPTLQQAIDQAGSPIKLLWKSGPMEWIPPVVPAEFVGWRQEQTATFRTASLADLSHHMDDLFIDGPDAKRLLAENTVNNYDRFVVGQAKQLVAVTQRGMLVNDCIVTKEGEESYTMVGSVPAQTWIRYHAATGDYNVTLKRDPGSGVRGGGDPVLFRYQLQGPNAIEIAERTFDKPIPETKFFHLAHVELGGRNFRALRHGMAGQPGFEFIGNYEDGEYVREALLKAGEPLGLRQMGANAYPTTGVESGWLAVPPPAIYTDPELKPYREWLSLYSFEGQFPFLNGSFYSENIEDYYVTPWDAGYGRLISFDHDFVGRDALLDSKDSVHRTKVTLEINPDDVAAELGPDFDFRSSHVKNRIEADGEVIGMTYFVNNIDRIGRLLALSIVDTAHSGVGTELAVIWGYDPGPTSADDAPRDFKTLRAQVAPTPYNEFARTGYRAN
jgi:vanillate/3-O-methylgallate O-demethylase